jgi:cell division protein FtsW
MAQKGGQASRADGGGLGVAVMAASAMGFGLVMVFSTTATVPFVRDGRLNPGHPLFHQTLYVLLSLAVILVASRIDSRRLASLSPWLLGLVGVLLVGLLVPGVTEPINGARRWYRVGPIGFQPSEFAKVALVLFLAWFLGRGRDPLRSFRTGFLPAAAVVAATVGLVAIQPDFGTSLFLAAIGGVLLLLAGARIVHVVPTLAIAGVTFAAFMIERFDHVRARIESWRDPIAHHNTEHSLLALGSGGIAGVGLGNGREKLAYLPENSTDFIFSIIGEELGFIGTVAVVAFFVAFVWQGAGVARRCRDTFGFYLAAGITVMVGLQALIHVAVATAAVPTKGIPLPFVSLGGSNLVCLAAGVGLLAGVARRGSGGQGQPSVSTVPRDRGASRGSHRTPGRG